MRKLSNRNVEIVMYHYVRDLQNSRYPKIKGLDLALFRQQIKYFKARSAFVTMQQVLQAAWEGTPLPEHAMLLTFDDGYRDHYDSVFPILMEHNIQGVFAMPAKILKEHKMLDVNKIHFILASESVPVLKQALLKKLDRYRGTEHPFPSNEDLYRKLGRHNRFDDADTVFIKRVLQSELEETLRNRITGELFDEFVSTNEKAFVHELYLSWDQVKLMKKSGMFFALHGYEHHWFDKLSPQEYEADVQKALTVFEGVIDPARWVFCYPYGAVQPSLLSYCSANGCVGGLTTEARTVDLDKDPPLLLPRYDTNDYPPKAAAPKNA